jgi:predicted RNase H-like HicB family nuclease
MRGKMLRLQSASKYDRFDKGGVKMKIEIEREEDGRWIAEVFDLPGVPAYGKTREEAVAKVEALALRVIADRIDHGEAIPELDELFALPA